MEPRIVYFSSATENTHHFVERLPFLSERIPLRKADALLSVHQPYVLFCPTYGGGKGEATVPRQVVKFLDEPEHRRLCVGVVGAGNINFGEKYGYAADVLSRKLQVPVLARFELRGTQDDVESIQTGMAAHWSKLTALRGLSSE